MYYLYLLQDKFTGKTYIGYTKDLKRRLREHRDYNKKLELVYYEAYKGNKDARTREMKLKQRGQTIRRLKERLVNSLIDK